MKTATTRDGVAVSVVDLGGKGELTEDGKVFVVANAQIAIWLSEARCFERRLARGAKVKDLIDEGPAFAWADDTAAPGSGGGRG